MRAATLISGLYPPAVRPRWGTEISIEVSEAGIRCWPDAAAGAARLWLHPSDWPETLAGQTRRVLAVALFAVAAGDQAHDGAGRGRRRGCRRDHDVDQQHHSHGRVGVEAPQHRVEDHARRAAPVPG
ncbi:hypothetical protein ACQEU6_02505 [Spirillospora sp. CA-108201]